MTHQLVILLHGVGSNGADMAALGNAWKGSLPKTLFEAPDAQHHPQNPNFFVLRELGVNGRGSVVFGFNGGIHKVSAKCQRHKQTIM